MIIVLQFLDPTSFPNKKSWLMRDLDVIDHSHLNWLLSSELIIV